MANVRGKSIDNTHLSIDTAEERRIIHRDYIAHCLRWSHVAKFMHASGFYRTARVLDIGCGRDVPLARMLYSNRLSVREYVGVDYNHSSKFETSMFENGKFPINTFGSVDYASNQVWFDKAKDGQHLVNVKGDNGVDYFRTPNIITFFEVIEHIEPAHGRAMLARILELMKLTIDNGEPATFFMSTPNWNVVACADNHVSEYKHQALGWMLEDVGFTVKEQYGTFASIRDYRDDMFKQYPGSKVIYEKLSKYYDSNMLSNIFAPLYPMEARNCIWRLEVRQDGDERKFPDSVLEDLAPYTSSEFFADIRGSNSSGYDPRNTGIGRMETPGNE